VELKCSMRIFKGSIDRFIKEERERADIPL
jgi:hypothetical protein